MPEEASRCRYGQTDLNDLIEDDAKILLKNLGC